jgi:hypothetical protein
MLQQKAFSAIQVVSESVVLAEKMALGPLA